MHWTETGLPRDVCADALAWAHTQPDLATAWRNCRRGDWMLWLAGKYAGGPGNDARRPLVLCACDCAELSAHLADDDTQMAIAWCLTLARDWAEGGETSPDDVQSAADAAPADAYASSAAYAAYAAAYAANAAYVSAGAAAYAAASAAAADADANANAAYANANAAYATRHEALAECADIVRAHYPEPPVKGE